MIQLIVPPLRQGGVYDFACRLLEAIGEDEAMLVHLSEENVNGWEIGPDDSLFLQLSGYGFAKRGAPLWLLHALQARRKQIKTLGIFFHEIYAFGPPWSSSFWLSPVQRHVSRRIAGLADFWMTSREGSAVWLRKYAEDKPHEVLPVFSTIGEPDSLPEARMPRIVIFGSAGLREAAYVAAGNNLFNWAKRASLEVHDFGSPIADAQLAETLRVNGVILHGRLDDQEVRRLMREAEYGLLAYPIEYVAKSSVFAAYCAHGICSVLISDNYIQVDGLVAGSHYLPDIPDLSPGPAVRHVGKVAREWYMQHSLQHHVAFLKRSLCRNGTDAVRTISRQC